MNAARQHRKAPVRLTPSVSCHIADVVSANGACVSTPGRADQRRSTWPMLLDLGEQALDRGFVGSRRSGTGVAVPPASLIRPATSSRACRSRAASTTCAPALASAAAVAAPMPRLAPVTTARRPGQPAASAPAHRTSRLAGRDARARQGSVPGQDGFRHGRGRPRREIPAALDTAPAAARMSSGGTRKPVTPSTITSRRPPRPERDDRSHRTPAPRRRPSRTAHPSGRGTAPRPPGP